jgi:hypothetical protein
MVARKAWRLKAVTKQLASGRGTIVIAVPKKARAGAKRLSVVATATDRAGARSVVKRSIAIRK